MSINIDVLFVDRENMICGVRSFLRPWRPFVHAGGSFAVIELPEGTIEKTNTAIGDLVDLNAELSEKGKEALLGKELASSGVISFNRDE